MTPDDARALMELVDKEIEQLEHEAYEADQYGVEYGTVDQKIAFWRGINQRLRGS